jgi:hypothetical protein
MTGMLVESSRARAIDRDRIEQLANPAAVIEQHRNDPFVALVTAQIEHEVLSSMASPFDDFMTRFRAMARAMHSELRAIYRLAAGFGGEFVLDPGNVRSGSSLDERVVAQMITANLHWRERHDGHPRETWAECWDWVLTAIQHNEDVGRQLAAKLDAVEMVKRKPLDAILRRVRSPLTDHPIQHRTQPDDDTHITELTRANSEGGSAP